MRLEYIYYRPYSTSGKYATEPVKPVVRIKENATLQDYYRMTLNRGWSARITHNGQVVHSSKDFTHNLAKCNSQGAQLVENIPLNSENP